jgi:HlyD family secretion protein
MKKKLSLYVAAGILVLAAATYFLWWNGSSKEIGYRTEKVSRGDVVIQVRATGTVNPLITVQVGSQVSGTISKLYADYNSVVRQGQIIGQIDSTFLNASVKEAEANLERAQAQVNEAKRNKGRAEELLKKDLISQAEADAAVTSYETSLAQLKQTQAALDRASVNLRFSVIRAPIDGVVISRDVDVGQTVAASLQAPKLFTIAKDLSRMQVEASVDEADIGQTRQGQQVTFTVDAYPNEEFHGVVTQVRLAPVIVQNVVTYVVIIEVPNPDLKLRPGMTATVSILIENRENVLRIPTLALRFQPPAEVLEGLSQETPPDRPSRQAGAVGDTSQPRRLAMMRRSGNERPQHPPQGEGRSERDFARVWVLEDGKTLRQRLVQTGLNNNRFVEVVDGDLKEGDEVIIGMTSVEATTSANQQQNPFAPRTSGGGPRRGGM